MKFLFFSLMLVLSHQMIAQIEIFDKSGNRAYSFEDSGNIQEKISADGHKTSYQEKVLVAASGKTYIYDNKWEQIISDGKVFISYNFNRRRWEWIEAADLPPSKFGKKEDIQRIYERTEDGFITPDQGDYPILTFKEGDYLDEFGEVAFSRKDKGSNPVWVSITLVHNYYQENYLDAAFMARLTAHRKAVADSLAGSNQLALAMLELGNNYETKETTFMGDHFEMIYFTMNEGAVQILNKEQIKEIKNNWLILNPDTYRRTAPFNIPEAGFFVSKKEAKKRSIQGINSKSIVLEVKIKPEYISDFRTAIGDQVN